MASPKISVITVCYNAAATIENCILSVLSQTYADVEYIVIDGASTDGTISILNKYRSDIDILVSEPDAGLYDAMNKGIAQARGKVIGILNADDYFASADALENVAITFQRTSAQAVYGDIDMVNAQQQPVRRWRSGAYNREKLKWGWMPPHPAFYADALLFKAYGSYNPGYGTAADYELMLRLLYKHRVTAVYLPRVLVKMRLGGVSNGSLGKRLKAWAKDFEAMKKHGVPNPVLAVLLKPLRKLKQYVSNAKV